MRTLTAEVRDQAYRVVAGDDADDFAWASKAPATWMQYASSLKLFGEWCEKSGASSMPADLLTVKGYLRSLIDTGRGYSSVNTFVTALSTAHRLRGLPFDRWRLRDTLKGIRRIKATPPRQAKPILGDEVQRLLEMLRTHRLADLRDATLIAVGWSGALRQSEVVGLDWQRQSTGTGFLVLDRRGITITLTRSKTSQAAPVSIVLPAEDMPTACELVDAWASRAGLKPGDALFRAIGNGVGILSNRRLAKEFPSRMLKQRITQLAMSSGCSEIEAFQMRSAISGHSMRAGFVTSAALKGIPEFKIRNHSRHKSAEMVARYVRAANSWTDSPVKGVGF